MVHTLRLTEKEEKKFKELYENQSFSKVVKKELFNTNTENKHWSGTFMLNLGALSTNINKIKSHIDSKDECGIKILSEMNIEVKNIWQCL